MLLCGMILSSSCNDFLNIVPKGQKIPTTLADYEALLRYEYNIARTPVMNALYLLNDRQVNKSELNSATLTRANYLWDESADRIELNNASEDTYYCLYGAISTCNLLLENVPSATECTEAERNEVMAYARVIRALCYFNLVNFYADTYQSATAASKLAVPWITSANINAPSRQVTVEELYGYMLEDIRTALDNGLPEESMTVLHPNRAAAHALLARIYLQMGNYEDALHYAEEALKYKDELFDWVAYYEQHKAQLELPEIIRRWRRRWIIITWRTITSGMGKAMVIKCSLNPSFPWSVAPVSRQATPASSRAGNCARRIRTPITRASPKVSSITADSPPAKCTSSKRNALRGKL